MTSRAYKLMEDLSSPMIAIYPLGEVKGMNKELLELLQKGEIAGDFRSVILDQYYAEFAKAAIRYCKNSRKTCVKVSENPYIRVLDSLFDTYGVDPDNADETGKTPVEYAAKLKYPEFVEYLVSKGSKVTPKKTPKKIPKKTPKKTPKKKPKKKPTKKSVKKCDFRATTSRCVNGTKQSRKCYRNDKTKRCRKRR